MAKAKTGSKGPRKPGSKPRSITRRAPAPVESKPIPLTPEDEAALREILDEGQALADTMEASLRKFAQLVLRRAFAKDHQLGRDPEANATPLLKEVLRRAGGPTLKLSSKLISLWVRIVSWERTITSEEFRKLDFTRKQYLLPLADAQRMADAAEHVVEFKLNEADTRTYAESLREGTKQEPIPRLTPARAGGALTKFVDRFTKYEALERLEQAIPELDEADRKALAQAVDQAEDVLARLRTALKRSGR